MVYWVYNLVPGPIPACLAWERGYMYKDASSLVPRLSRNANMYRLHNFNVHVPERRAWERGKDTTPLGQWNKHRGGLGGVTSPASAASHASSRGWWICAERSKLATRIHISGVTWGEFQREFKFIYCSVAKKFPVWSSLHDSINLNSFYTEIMFVTCLKLCFSSTSLHLPVACLQL